LKRWRLDTGPVKAFTLMMLVTGAVGLGGSCYQFKDGRWCGQWCFVGTAACLFGAFLLWRELNRHPD